MTHISNHATASLSQLLRKHLDDIHGKHSSMELQKMVTLETTQILRKILMVAFHLLQRSYHAMSLKENVSLA
jgi:hypothetical protein